MSNIIVNIDSYIKKYGKNIVLNNINLKIEEGKIYGIIGRNGSGKTLLLKAICGLINATKGYVEVFNKRIGKDTDFPEDTGVIIESPGFLPNLSGIKNLEVLANIQGKITTERIYEVMKFVGLNPYEKKIVKKYSLGMKQRLGIAQAIMEYPKLLILDEPMNRLDKDGVEDIRNYINKSNLKTYRNFWIFIGYMEYLGGGWKWWVLIVDEMSARFHPLLTKLIVDMFKSSSNKKA